MKLPDHITIATRESPLALWQAHHIQQQLLMHYPTLTVKLLGITTQGDRIIDVTLNKIGGKGLFVKELEQALLDGRADLAVHSMKDVPMTLASGLALAAICEREDPRDAFVSNQFHSLADLPPGSIVGTSSLRRESQIRARFPELVIKPLRGNVGSRLRKLDAGEYHGIVLAAAGLKRLELEGRICEYLSTTESLPSPGQGALALEVCAKRTDLLALLASLNHPVTAACVGAERAVSRQLNGSCQLPLGVFCEEIAEKLMISAFVAEPDGSHMVRATAFGAHAEAERLGLQLAQQLLANGAAAILSRIER